MPLHVFTGFLGSGKTELLRQVLGRTEERVAVLVNEVGELAVDHHLLEEIDEGVLALPNGCVCCALRDDLHAAIARVAAARPDRIVLETTGLADPAPILGALDGDPKLRASLVPGGVVAVVDCLRGEELFRSHQEMRRQLDFADRVVLSKGDLAPERIDPMCAWLAESCPGREVRVASRGDVDLDWLFRPPRYDGDRGAFAWLRAAPEAGPSRHDAFTKHAVRADRPVDIDALQLWLRLVTQLDGERILRVKAVARCASTGSVHVLQSAGRAVSPPQRLAGTGAAVAGAQVVVIERGMPAAALGALLAALQSALAGNQAEA